MPGAEQGFRPSLPDPPGPRCDLQGPRIGVSLPSTPPKADELALRPWGGPHIFKLRGLCLPGSAVGHPSWALTVSSSCPINLDRGTCAPQHVINNLEHTFMDSAISAAFNPIALYGTYMRLLYCCNYFALYASFLPPSFYFFLHFIPFPSKAWSPGRKSCPGPIRVAEGQPGWPRATAGP